jgi:CheY-like chemotaxis protein
MKSPENKTILIVDDEPDFLTILAENLEKDYNVIEASNGEIAWQTLIRGEEIDLVVTDVKMPTMGGLDLLEKIQNILTNPPKVILISGFTNFSDRKIKEIGAIAMYDKPIDWKVFLDFVRGAITD